MGRQFHAAHESARVRADCIPNAKIEREVKSDGCDIAGYLTPEQWNRDVRKMTFWLTHGRCLDKRLDSSANGGISPGHRDFTKL
jgi:hypothetical protein